jgi:hypothetical protein
MDFVPLMPPYVDLIISAVFDQADDRRSRRHAEVKQALHHAG